MQRSLAELGVEPEATARDSWAGCIRECKEIVFLFLVKKKKNEMTNRTFHRRKMQFAGQVLGLYERVELIET